MLKSLSRKLRKSPAADGTPRRAPVAREREHTRARRGAGSWALLAVLVLPMATVAAAAAWNSVQNLAEDEIELLTVPVRRAPLDVSVTERGTLDSGDNVAIRCRVEGGATTILKIAPEGALVLKDEVVVELDSSRFVQEAALQRIRVFRAEAALKTSEAGRAIQKIRNDSLIGQSEQRLRIARLDLKKYTDGDYRLSRERFDSEIRLAHENLTTAQDRQSHTKSMQRKGYATSQDCEAERVAVTKLEIALGIAQEKLSNLEKFTHPRALAEKNANVTKFERELERIKMRAQWMLAQRDVELLSRKRSAAIEQERLRKVLRQIECCTINSPRDGIVVYANNTQNRGGAEPLIYEGAKVREGQPLINLPNIAHMQVDARIHESKILQVEEGQPALIHLDARGGETFHGVVEKVSTVPLSASWPNLNLREYATVVRIVDEQQRVVTLKPGLTAEVTILVERLESALQVPVQSCIERNGRYFAWVNTNSRECERREIHVGHANDAALEVVEGLVEGEQIVCNPRTGIPEAVSQLELEFPEVERIAPPETPALDPAFEWMYGLQPAEVPEELAGGEEFDSSPRSGTTAQPADSAASVRTGQ